MSSKMKKKEPTLVRMFVIIGHEDKPIKIYGPQLNAKEILDITRKRKEVRKGREAKKAVRDDIRKGSQSTIHQFFGHKRIR